MAKKKATPKPREGELVPAEDRLGDLLDGGALMAEAISIPVVSMAVRHVLDGWSRQRQEDRVREALHDLDRRLRATQARISDEYVRSDEFEDSRPDTAPRCNGTSRGQAPDVRRLSCRCDQESG